MRHTKLILTSLALAAITGTIQLCAPAISQTAGMIPTGSCTLPAGQYMLTNMRTGQAVYVEIDQSGKLLAQDPKALQFSVSAINYNNPGYGLGTAGSTIPGGAIPGTIPGTTQHGGMWGGLLKEGMQSIMNNRNSPTSAPIAAPTGIQQ